MKYAIVENGRNQVMLKEGDMVLVDSLDLEKGKSYTWDKILAFRDGEKFEVGTPHLKGVKVKGKIGDQIKGDKVVNFKKKKRKGYKRKVGHRQTFTEVTVEEIK